MTLACSATNTAGTAAQDLFSYIKILVKCPESLIMERYILEQCKTGVNQILGSFFQFNFSHLVMKLSNKEGLRYYC